VGSAVAYDETFHAKRGGYREPAERCLLAAFAHFGVPESFLDLGCGTGNLVGLASRIGVSSSCGIDVSFNVVQQPAEGGGGVLVRHDLLKPLTIWDDRFDLVWCTEVAEHLPDASELLSAVVRYAGDRVIWTAAQPGQGGVGHVNEKSRGYWSHEFALRGLRYEAEESEDLRSTWRKVAGRCKWYPENLSVFRRSHG
jgi:SAM-dependent methyltransferase